MERKTGLKGLVLTLNNNSKSMTDEEAKEQCNRLLTALKVMAKRKGWSYVILVFFSRKEQDADPLVGKWIVHEYTPKRPHFHVILYANPCSTIVDWLQNYWNAPKKSRRKRLGIVKRHDIYNFNGFVSYCDRQKAFKERRQKYIGDADLDFTNICNYEKNEESQ